ncbi:MAG: hypothetical protein H6639_16335 [Caldilineaceae bacterium]|nr:hypothetical protein [Caldilineaceae bacterium]
MTTSVQSAAASASWLACTAQPCRASASLRRSCAARYMLTKVSSMVSKMSAALGGPAHFCDEIGLPRHHGEQDQIEVSAVGGEIVQRRLRPGRCDAVLHQERLCLRAAFGVGRVKGRPADRFVTA